MQMGVEQDDSLSEGNENKISVSDDDQSTQATMTAVRSVTIPYIYRQDIVRSMKRGMFGIATEVPGDSDSDSSVTDEEDDGEEEDDNDDEEEVEDDGDNEDGNDDDKNKSNNESDRSASGNCKSGPLSDHQVRVLWMDETESIENMNDVEVIDRGFLHGDYVAAASDPTGQVGVVVDVNITCDLMAPSEAIVKDISSKDLKRVRDFNVGDYVVLGTWLGRVDDVVDNLTVLFDDGSVCKVTKADPMHLKPISKNLLEDGHFTYYPGQRVKGSSSSVFKYSSWLSGLWKPNRLEGTVTKVTVGSVFVYWIASAGYGPDSSTAPAEEQSPKNLKLLSCFAHASWQLGDWCLLPASVRSSAISLDMGLSKLELHDSINGELDPSQMGSGFDSEEVALEELNGKEDAMDVDRTDGSEGNGKEKKASHESGSSGGSQSVSRDSIRDTWPLHRKKIRKVVIRRDKKVRKKVENFEKALMIVNTRTTVDVAWQDGTIEHGAEGTKLIPIDNPGDHEFVAEQYVVEKTTDDDEMSCESRRVGVVQSVNAKDRTACVRWLKQVSRAEDPREFEKVEVVSVYELESHPDYDYCYGDVVVRLCPVSLSSQTIPDRDSDHTKMQIGSAGVKQESDNADDESGNDADMDFSELSWVGNITGLKNGDIEVTWADGMVSTVGPQAIYVVGRDDDDGDSVPAGSEISDAVSWETVNEDERNVLEDSKEEVRLSDSTIKIPDAEDDMQSNSGKNAALSMPLAAIRFVTRLASGIFSRGQKNFDPLCLHSQGKNDIQSDGLETSEGKATSEEYHSPTSSSLDTGDKQQDDRKMKDYGAAEVSKVGEAAEVLCNLKTEEGNGSACEEDESSNFKRFDIVKDPSDHYFIGAGAQNNNSRRWLKKVQQDWSILHNNLPEGVYVRVYEDRMDLLRAVIVGAYGTPYQDGLFFFDFHLPSEYPDAPPSAYYHSGGWRINPNLYEEGKVCLSLLNTWTGRGNEVWDPKSSSILQVLVSLQGLVLNSKPYFNEAGYDKHIGKSIPLPMTAPTSSVSGRFGPENSTLEFEAKSGRDGAWYDVTSFMSHRHLETGDPEVLVHFAGFGPEEDEWVNVRRHVRPRSLPCESSECVAVLPGDLILCFQEGQEQALYFDAHVLDAQRRRHDVRGCRCRFLVRYDHDMSEEIVPLRKVCRRPETDYRLQQLHGLNETALLDQQNISMNSVAVPAVEVSTSAETMTKERNTNVVMVPEASSPVNVPVPSQAASLEQKNTNAAGNTIAGNCIIPDGAAAFISNIATSSGIGSIQKIPEEK